MKRSKTDKVIGGVCGGLGKYTGEIHGYLEFYFYYLGHFGFTY